MTHAHAKIEVKCRLVQKTERTQPISLSFPLTQSVNAADEGKNASSTNMQQAIVWFCLRDPMFSRIDKTPTCDRQTDRQTQTDGHRALAHTALV